MIVLDTNVLSELLRPEPARQVEQWLSGQDGAQVYRRHAGRHGIHRAPGAAAGRGVSLRRGG
jgi:predicted nucleic acid-binding protein